MHAVRPRPAGGPRPASVRSCRARWHGPVRHASGSGRRCRRCRPPRRAASGPARGASQSIIASFHSRWTPPDIRSFMMSYLLATRGKDAMDHARLVLFAHGLEAEMGGLVAVRSWLAGPDLCRPRYRVPRRSYNVAACRKEHPHARIAGGRDSASRADPGDGRASASRGPRCAARICAGPCPTGWPTG